MNFSRFLEEHRGNWRQLDQLLDRVQSEGLKRLSAEEVRDLARLYRKASADLLLVRTLGARADVVDYLEAVVGRAYTAIYASRKMRWSRLFRYLTHDWPLRARAERRYVQLSLAIFGLGLLCGFVLTQLSPAAFEHIVPAEFAAPYSERADDPRAARFGDLSDAEAAAFSSSLMVNNIRVTLRCFALGLTLAVGTIASLFFNGILIGAIAANHAAWGQSLEFWALILPHGVVEMFCIGLGGAGGLMLGDAIVRPGRRRRIDALRERGAAALSLVGMAVPMLIFAGIAEAYVTPNVLLPPVAKLGFAGLTALALGVYLAAPWLKSPAAPP